LPDGGITLDKVSKLLGEKLEPKKGSWYYYKKLQQYKQNNPLPNFIASDDHSLWPKDLPEAEKKLLENQIKYKLKEVAEQVTKRAGSIPGELSEIIKSLKQKEPVFNWKKYFRRVIGNAITSEIQLTRMRPSKRFPDARGIRMKRKPNILVGVDTSGSVNNEEFAEFFAEIHHIYKTGVSVTVAECDTQITNIFEYKGNQDIKRTGYGGTVLHPIVDYYKEHPEFTVCVIFTDGYCDTTMPSCQNLIWVITSSGNKSTKYTPGKVIFIPNKA
jgi:predicted metal-dependent peptidase